MSKPYRPPQNDERLVMFLQQFRPSAPPAPLESEEQLFLLLDRPSVEEGSAATSPRAPRVRSWKHWVLPVSALAIGSLLTVWGSHRVRAPQLAERSTEELEEFIVRSWEGFAPIPTDTLRSFEADWLLRQENVGIGTTTGVSAASFEVQAEPAVYP